MKTSDGRRETGDGSSSVGEAEDGGLAFSTDIARRDLLKLFAAAPLAQFAVRMGDVELAARRADEVLRAAAERGAQFKPKFFTGEEWRLTRVLADRVIPKDARSGSATDAGVPEFMDFMMTAYPDMQKWMRSGLAWTDSQAKSRFKKAFADSTAAQQTELLDDVAYPKKARADMKQGAEFFTRFRNLTASGFWSSRIGVADLQYLGNRPQSTWNGCPPPALAKLGVSYGDDD